MDKCKQRDGDPFAFCFLSKKMRCSDRSIEKIIYNRLRQRIPLGIDATLQYRLGSWRPLTALGLKLRGPYNTRTSLGLPPTPICNPGIASLQAAAQPAKVDYLYYVAIPRDPQRRHFFTKSYAAFLAFQRKHPA